MCNKKFPMTQSKLLAITLLVLTVTITVSAYAKSPGEFQAHALDRSNLTASGSQPFHLKADVLEITNSKNDNYRATIEEYWAAPDKWRRVVTAPNFAETLVVNGDKAHEDLTGDYYPNWLRTLVSGIFEFEDRWKGIELSQAGDNPMIGGTKFCRRFEFRAGIAPISNRIFSVYCLNRGLVDSVQIPGYSTSYDDYKPFATKDVARKIREYIEPGTELEARISDLAELDHVDESLFAVGQPNEKLKTIQVNEATLRGIAAVAPLPIQWPTIRDGKPSGVLSLYVCIDRSGKVREIYALNSDNPYMSDAARDSVMKWQFKPAASKGAPVQIESILTFAYETRIEGR